MSEEIPVANLPLSDEEQSLVAKLADAELHDIDAAILAQSSKRWTSKSHGWSCGLKKH